MTALDPALVRRRRVELGLSRRGLARRAGLSEGAVRLVECGAGNHRPETLYRLRRALFPSWPDWECGEPRPSIVPVGELDELLATMSKDDQALVLAFARRLAHGAP